MRKKSFKIKKVDKLFLKNAVERGAKLLDKKEKDWFYHDFKNLEMSICSRCILGQLYGNFFKGQDILFPDTGDNYLGVCTSSLENGFDVSNSLCRTIGGYNEFYSGNVTDEVYAYLAKRWNKAIKKRLKSLKSVDGNDFKCYTI